MEHNKITPAEYCELSKLYLKKLAELESKKLEELELNSEKYGIKAVETYMDRKATTQQNEIEFKLKEKFQKEQMELQEIIQKMLSYIGNVQIEEVGELENK